MNYSSGLVIVGANMIEDVQNLLRRDPAIIGEKFCETIHLWRPVDGKNVMRG